VIVRVGDDEPRLMLSDPSAADDWDLAASVVDLLDLDEDEEDGDEPVGDLDLLEDLGVGEAVLAELLDDPDAYPDEVLSDVARLLGFGEAFDEVAGLASA